MTFVFLTYLEISFCTCVIPILDLFKDIVALRPRNPTHYANVTFQHLKQYKRTFCMFIYSPYCSCPMDGGLHQCLRFAGFPFASLGANPTDGPGPPLLQATEVDGCWYRVFSEAACLGIAPSIRCDVFVRCHDDAACGR